MSRKVDIPANITLLPLPLKCPELNPVENVWQFMRDNWLSNRIFSSYDNVVDHCCHAWNRLINQPLAHHVHRFAPVGAWVMIRESWNEAPDARCQPQHGKIDGQRDPQSTRLSGNHGARCHVRDPRLIDDTLAAFEFDEAGRGRVDLSCGLVEEAQTNALLQL